MIHELSGAAAELSRARAWPDTCSEESSGNVRPSREYAIHPVQPNLQSRNGWLASRRWRAAWSVIVPITMPPGPSMLINSPRLRVMSSDCVASLFTRRASSFVAFVQSGSGRTACRTALMPTPATMSRIITIRGSHRWRRRVRSLASVLHMYFMHIVYSRRWMLAMRAKRCSR